MLRSSKLPIVASLGLVLAFYFWTSVSDNLSWHWGEEQTDYYNLLVHGFLDGHLSLKAEVPQAVLESSNPYDPAQRPAGVALHDASLFRGKYYIYHGVVPAVLLLLPFRVLAGFDLPLGPAVLIFVGVGYAFALLILADIRRRFFANVGPAMTILLGVSVGFAACTPILLRRSSMYDLPIASGHCFALAALFFFYQALFQPARRTRWLIATSLCWGLAIGSRPTYLFAPVGLAFAWSLFFHPDDAAPLAWPARWRLLGAAIVPLAAIGLLLALYNFLRFGNPVEFGVTYILSGVYESKIEHFRLRYLPWNFYAYFFAEGEWGRYFPFLHEGEIKLPRPWQHFGMDIPFGLIAHLPFLWLAALAPAAGLPREGGPQKRELRLFLASVAWVAFAVAGFLLLFYAAMARYLADFAPVLALLAAIGAMAVLAQPREGGEAWSRRVAGTIIAGCAVVSLFVFFVFSVKIYDRVRSFNPVCYQALARWANAPVHALERVVGDAEGPINLELVFSPQTAGGQREMLVATGWGGEKDRVGLVYPDREHVQISYEHAGAPVILSAVLAVDRSIPHRLRIALGSLLPPETHPVFDGWSPQQKVDALRRLQIEVDGRLILDRYQRFYDASPGCLTLGGESGEIRFSGRIARVTRERVRPPAWRETAGAAAAAGRIRPGADGVFRLSVRFPRGTAGAREPLVVSGQTGRADFVVVEYLDGGRCRLLLDHWGRRPYFSEPFAYEPDHAYRVEISHPFYAPPPVARTPAGAGRFAVVIEGNEVWQCVPLFFPVDPEDIFVGRNPVGGSSCSERFGGEIAAASP